MAIQQVLDELGLKKNKGVVYLASLETGSGTALEIATKARLPRTTVIEILDALAAMALVSYVTKGRARIYSAESPEKLKALLKDKERSLASVLPELKSLVSTKGRRPKIRVYDGLAGVKTVFEDTLTVSDKQLRGILSMADLYKIPGKGFMDDYVVRRIKAGIQLRVMRSEIKEIEETWPTSVTESRTLRYAPADFVFPMTQYLYDNKVGLIGTEKENFGMIIESEDFYQTQKNLFEIMWQVSRITKSRD
ncbi:MAG: hypothetical protein HYY50_00515 [Candidatus Kerfeldbacteria bacterium]|nr:hypothetical protein [Candidatus Kerfeldbacteria bacterium]